ncbi:MAG: hypothetical protein AAFV43_06550 [Planctomycetota bacterium]
MMADLLLLMACAAVMAHATLYAWRGTRSYAIPMGALFCYYWSLHGAWTITLTGGDLGNHDYLMDDLVTVVVDNNYRLTLVLYTVFAVLMLHAARWVGAVPGRLPDDGSRIRLNAPQLIIACALCAIGSYLIIRGPLGMSAATGVSLYNLTRYEGVLGTLGVVLTILNRMALVPAAIGLAAWLSGPRGRFVVMPQRPGYAVGFGGVLVGMLGLCFLLGNKNEILFAATTGALFYLANSPRPRVLRLGVSLASVLLCLVLFDNFRSASVAEVKEDVSVADTLAALASVGATGECYAAHLSLYGVLNAQMTPDFGASFLSLAASVVPRSLWENRPEEIYWYYIEGVGASKDQGFTIHHATGWYLNFGMLGVLTGGVFVGAVWGQTIRLMNTSRSGRRWFVWRVLTTFAACTFTGNMPTLLRTGIEGYKGFVVHSFIASLLVLVLCSTLVRRRTTTAPPIKRPSLRRRPQRVAAAGAPAA